MDFSVLKLFSCLYFLLTSKRLPVHVYLNKKKGNMINPAYEPDYDPEPEEPTDPYPEPEPIDPEPTEPEPEPGSSIPTSQVQEQRDALVSEYLHELVNHLGISDFNVKLLFPEDRKRFKIVYNQKKGFTQLKFLNDNMEWVDLKNKINGNWLEKTTLEQRLGASGKRIFGWIDTPSAAKKQAAKKLRQIIPTELEMESIPLNILDKTVDDITSEIEA